MSTKGIARKIANREGRPRLRTTGAVSAKKRVISAPGSRWSTTERPIECCSGACDPAGRMGAGGALSNRSAGDPSVIPRAFLVGARRYQQPRPPPQGSVHAPAAWLPAGGNGRDGDVEDITEANGTVYLLPYSRARSRPLGAGTSTCARARASSSPAQPWVSECVLCAQTLPLLDCGPPRVESRSASVHSARLTVELRHWTSDRSHRGRSGHFSWFPERPQR
jgi:hypothetical protein